MARRANHHHELTQLSLRACQIAEDAAANLREILDTDSPAARNMALLAIRQCEEELDQIERTIDERLPQAISRVGEDKARELLASLKFITDLERIGDLISWVAQRLRPFGRLPKEAISSLKTMTAVLEVMLRDVRRGFLERDLELADSIMAADKEIDRSCRALFQRYLRQTGGAHEPLDVLLMVQALERAGDHATNLAEELHHLIEGRSLRHAPTISRASRMAETG